MANRVRTERLEIKLTKEEKELFQAKMRQAKCKSMNHFLRKCVLEKEIYTVDLKPFNELQGLLANATSNINWNGNKNLDSFLKFVFQKIYRA